MERISYNTSFGKKKRQSNVCQSSPKYKAKQGSLVDIAKLDFEFNLSEEDQTFLQDEGTSRHLSFGITQLLARLERNMICQKIEHRRNKKAQKAKETLTMVSLVDDDNAPNDNGDEENFCERPSKKPQKL